MKKVESLTEKGEVVVKNPPPKVKEHVETFAIALTKDPQVVADGTINANQLKDLIKEAVKDQVESVTQPSYT